MLKPTKYIVTHPPLRVGLGARLGKKHHQELAEIIQASLLEHDGYGALVACEELYKFLRRWARNNLPIIESKGIINKDL
jgi:hypothetical protein